MLPLLALLAVGTPACRYTVRDIGFVDLTGADYALTHAAPKDAGLTTEARALLGALTRDGNVALAEGEAPTGWSLRRAGLDALPLAVEGRDEVAARGALDAALRSPIRDEVLAHALGSFAVVLRVRGTDADEAARIDGVLEAARRGLGILEAGLPRPIDRPLVDLELARDARGEEAVLLWSLGLAAESPEPALAVLYGRGKLAGRVMVGAAITEHELLAQLALVGESCECDTPRDWFGEPRIPLAWTDRQRARAATELGFDPESPMVKSEVVRILERGPLSGPVPRGGAPEGAEALVFGYQELELETADGAPAPRRDFAPDEGAPTSGAPTRVIEGAEGDDWSFEELAGEDGVIELDGATIGPPPELESSVTDHGARRGGPGLRTWALLILVGVGIGSYLTWVVLGSKRGRA